MEPRKPIPSFGPSIRRVLKQMDPNLRMTAGAAEAVGNLLLKISKALVLRGIELAASSADIRRILVSTRVNWSNMP